MDGRQLGVPDVGVGFFVGGHVVFALRDFPVLRYLVPFFSLEYVLATFSVFRDRFVQYGRASANPRLGEGIARHRPAFRHGTASHFAHVFCGVSNHAAHYRFQRRVRDSIFNYRSLTRLAVRHSTRNLKA